MDEEDVVRVGMEVVLRPVTDIAADVLGLALGDWVHERRERNRARLHERTREVLRERNVTPEDASPTILLPLLTAAQDESREELLDLWAKLLAAAVDPSKADSVRRAYIDAVKQMEPFDAVVLQEMRRVPSGSVADELPGLNRSSDAVLISLQHLYHLGCVMNPGGVRTNYMPEGNTALTPFGRELLKVLNSDDGERRG